MAFITKSQGCQVCSIFYLMPPLMQRYQASNRWLNYQLNILDSEFPIQGHGVLQVPISPLGLFPPPTSIGFPLSLSHFHSPQLTFQCIFKDSSHRFKQQFCRTSTSGSVVDPPSSWKSTHPSTRKNSPLVKNSPPNFYFPLTKAHYPTK